MSQIILPRDCAIADGAFDGCGTVHVFALAGGATEAACEAMEDVVFVAMPLSVWEAFLISKA